jgi:Carboxypeptidase controlling helical cell shape catalytic/C-terminal domain of metallo-carboxypeptidase
MKLSILLLLASFIALPAFSFSLIKKECDKTPVLLVIGGIHGNEPGSYFATAMLTQYYTIKKGNLWIIPNLNRDSIQQDNRGIYGDMNRKFANIDPKDPDFATVREVQNIITDPHVGLILNLHDGHGFYRKEYQNTILNPSAWGQTCVIDQGTLDTNNSYGNLDEIASKVRGEINGGLIEDHHLFDVRNTNTRFDDEEMKHSLTYFAVNHHKPAFAIETSKNLPTLQNKVFYQLRAIECYMKLMGIEFERSFDLTPEAIQRLLASHGSLTINNGFYLNLENLKTNLSLIPIQSIGNDFKFSHPLGSVQKNKQKYDLYIGNQKICSLSTSFHPKGMCSDKLTIVADGQQKNIAFATDFFVNTDFKIVNNDPDIRVNIIGYTQKGVVDESNHRISLKDLDTKYAIDRSSKSYRVEFYRKNDFCGMILIHFK